ncbi:MAG: hypothetical protein KBF60_13205, partial [Ignavibacteriaceae bacterium]|nr:hypothetical protein [Ignavibacteriaceae bacterium]
MKANKVKRMEAISYQTDANFYPLSEKYYYSYNYEYNEMGMITLVDYFNVEQDLRIETTYAYDQYGTIESIVVTETSGGTQSSNPVVTHTTFWATVTDGTIERMTKYVSGELTNVYLFNYDGLGLASILDSTVDLSSGVPNT